VTRSQSATLSEVARGRRGRSPPSESPSEPVAKKKRGVGATIDGLKLKMSELEASVFYGSYRISFEKFDHCVIKKSNTLLQDKLGAEELRISHIL
jgi:hypothetical protein